MDNETILEDQENILTDTRCDGFNTCKLIASKDNLNIDEIQNIQIKVICEILETLHNQQAKVVLEHKKTRQLIKKAIIPIANKLTDLLLIGLLFIFLIMTLNLSAKSNIDVKKEIIYSLIAGAGAAVTAYEKWNKNNYESNFNEED